MNGANGLSDIEGKGTRVFPVMASARQGLCRFSVPDNRRFRYGAGWRSAASLSGEPTRNVCFPRKGVSNRVAANGAATSAASYRHRFFDVLAFSSAAGFLTVELKGFDEGFT